MADLLDSLTRLVNSPPGQIAAGGLLAGIVWKFFERVEAVLTDQTKHEIARWLRVKSFEAGLVFGHSSTWQLTFCNMFDRVFGRRHLSWACFWRSVVASLASCILAVMLALTLAYRPGVTLFSALQHRLLCGLLKFGGPCVIVADYMSLIKTRKLLYIARGGSRLLSVPILAIGGFWSDCVGCISLALVFIAPKLSADPSITDWVYRHAPEVLRSKLTLCTG